MLHVDDSAPTAVLSLAHGKVNALDVELLEAVADRLAALATSQCTALVVTGRGRVFSAGVDLFRVLEGGEDYVDRLIPALGRAVQAVFEFPKPVIAAVNGPAIAGGYTIAAACNRCIVADDAPIGASEVRVGVPMPVPVLEVLRYACGDRAEAVTLSGQLFRGADAVAHRLADEVLPATEVLGRALAVAGDLGGIPGNGYGLAKQRLRQPVGDRIKASASTDADVRRIWASPAAAAAMRASLERTTRRHG
jgi:enoyl-CoA hydratase/carnithine racemase